MNPLSILIKIFLRYLSVGFGTLLIAKFKATPEEAQTISLWIMNVGGGILAIAIPMVWSFIVHKYNLDIIESRNEKPQQSPSKNLATIILSGLMIASLSGCVSAPSVPDNAPSDPNATTPQTQTLFQKIQAGGSELQAVANNPIFQASMQPAGFLSTCAALTGYSLSGGEDVSAMAGKIVTGCSVALKALNGSKVDPLEVSGTMNLNTPAYNLTFGPVQTAVDNLAKKASGGTAVDIQNTIAFINGVKAAASFWK